MSQRINMSLRQKTIFAVILIIGFFGSLSVGAVFFYAKNSLTEKKKEELKSLISAQSLGVSQIFKNSADLAGTIAKQDFVMEYLRGEREAQKEEILNLLDQYNINGKYSAIYLLDQSGNALVSTDPSFVGENYSFREYFKESIKGIPAVDYAVGVTSLTSGYYFSYPVEDDAQNVVGIMVVKMDPGVINKALRLFVSQSNKVMLVDDSGVIIFSSKEDRLHKTLGPIAQETKELLAEERKYEGIEIYPLQYGPVQDKLSTFSGAEIVEIFDEKEGEDELLGVKRIGLYHFYLVIEEEFDEYIGSAMAASALMAFFMLLAILGAGIILSILINKFLTPLDVIEDAALKISQGNWKTRIDERHLGSELKKLASSFNGMVDSVQKSRKEVDKKVEEQVVEIKEKSLEIENQQKATINILEDVNNSQKELKLRYKELDIIKSLTQRLGATLEEHSVMKNIAMSLRELFPDAVVSYVIFPIFGEEQGSEPNSVYVHSLKAVEKKYLSQVREWVISGAERLPLYLKKKEYWQRWIQKGFVAEVGNEAKIGKQDGVPLSHINIPLAIPNTLAGLINVSSGSASLFNDQKNIEIVNSVIENAIKTIERLKILITSEHSRLQDLVESLRSAVLMFDENKRLAVANSNAKEIFNIQNANFSLEDTFVFLEKGKIPGKDSLDIRNLYAEVIYKNKTHKIESLELGRHFFEIIITPVNNFQKEVSGGVIILHDITHLKAIDRMKTEFVSVASHQLRTPLTAINWYVEMLQSGDAGKLNKNQKVFLDEIYKGSVRMVKLVNELLNVSRLETGRLKISPKLMRADKLIEDVIHELEAFANKSGCAVIFNRPKKVLPKIALDETLMRQVIHNLITNAVRYSPAQKSEVVVSLAEKGGEYLVSVADQGIGIPREAQGKIFQKFFRADNARKVEGEGSGIGMYISKMIMEASSGRLWFESPTFKKKGAAGKTEEYGTTFYAAVPKSGMVEHEGERGLAI